MNANQARAKIKAAGINPADVDTHALAAWIRDSEADDAAEIAAYLEEGLLVPAYLLLTDRDREVHFWDSLAGGGFAHTDEAHQAALRLAG